jgi:hypothetical protein
MVRIQVGEYEFEVGALDLAEGAERSSVKRPRSRRSL